MISNETYIQAVINLIDTCAKMQVGERVLIISDKSTMDIGSLVHMQVAEKGGVPTHITIEGFVHHGEEPSQEVADKMLQSDVIFGLTKMSLAHSKARYNATLKGSRYLSLPDYSWYLLSRPAIFFDFASLESQSKEIAEVLDNADTVRITNLAGTDIQLSIKGRKANAAPGSCFAPGIIASPPDAEVNIAPLETETNGVICVNGSIPITGFGLLDEPIFATVKQGKIISFTGKNNEELMNIFNRVNNPDAFIVAEFGIGLNPLAELCGMMLEDEGCLGTAHFGIGSNATIGGKNSVPIHIDLVIRDATIYVNDSLIMKEGIFLNNNEWKQKNFSKTAITSAN